MGKKKFLVKARRSRKTYLPIYILFLVGAGLLLYLNNTRGPLGSEITIAFLLAVFFGIKFAEFHRFRDWWGITENSFVESTGIFNKNVREVDFSSISDLDVSQPFLKRILGFGDVNIRLFINETSIHVKNINFPSDFADFLQEKIGERRADGQRKLLQ